MSRRIAAAPRVVQRASESSCSPIGIRKRVFAVAGAVTIVVVTIVCVVLSSRYPYEEVSPLFHRSPGVYNYRSKLTKRVRARVWWKEVSGKLSM